MFQIYFFIFHYSLLWGVCSYVLKAMEAVESLEKLKDGKNISVKIELRCKNFALYQQVVLKTTSWATANLYGAGILKAERNMVTNVRAPLRIQTKHIYARGISFVNLLVIFLRRSYCKTCNMPVFFLRQMRTILFLNRQQC